MKNEMWLPIEGWSAYEVSSIGRVRRVGGTAKCRQTRILKTSINDKGYMQAHLRDAGREKNVPVHRLVALAFLGQAPSPQHEVAHLDGNGRNPCLTNLAWKLPIENNADKKIHGTYSFGERHHTARLSTDEVKAIRTLRESGLSHQQIAQRIGCGRRHVGKILSGQQRGLG